MNIMPTLEGGLRSDIEDPSDWQLLVGIAHDAISCDEALADRLGNLVTDEDVAGDWKDYVVPDLAADAKNSAGYRGGHEFAIVEKVLARRFPLHDDSGEPTGTMRQLQYKLVKGVAGPTLKLHQAPEF